MRHAHHVCAEHNGRASIRQKEAHDTNVRMETYKPGDLIWFRTEIGQLDVAPKLRRPFEGPFLVVERLSALLYVIQMGKTKARRVVHHNRLKPYYGDQILPWAKAALKK